jgi:hypothetical protein
MIWAILIIVVALVLAWNFIPAFRARIKGFSTILEGILGTILYYFGVFGEAIQDMSDSGYIPEDWQQFVPFVILGWIVIKRFQTKTPVKEK